MENPDHSEMGRARLNAGSWYCACGLPARCITTRKSGPNTGRKFWRCTNPERQCNFFLWVDHEDGAREWIKLSQPQPPPATPTGAEIIREVADISLQSPQTPFTNTKRKELSRNVPIDLEAGDSANHKQNDASDPFQIQTTIESHDHFGHARKASKTSIVSTPGQSFVERLQSCTLPLPTPSTRDQLSQNNRLASRSRTMHRRDGSPTPGGLNDVTDPNPIRDSNLTATILELVRADHPSFKDSTEVQIRHEVGLALDVCDIKLRRYEGTIAELLKKVDELETIVSSLT